MNPKYRYLSLFVPVIDSDSNYDFPSLAIGINKGLTGAVRLHSFQFVKDLNGVILIFESESE
jgi:hypothetical protein